jgi:hypothetical protein
MRGHQFLHIPKPHESIAVACLLSVQNCSFLEFRGERAWRDPWGSFWIGGEPVVAFGGSAREYRAELLNYCRLRFISPRLLKWIRSTFSLALTNSPATVPDWSYESAPDTTRTRTRCSPGVRCII